MAPNPIGWDRASPYHGPGMRLTKHHGLGNDFLVLLDLEGVRPVTAAEAVELCDRRTGVGADGVMRVTAGAGDADVTMTLLNADGSVAEMSGNGIRCLAQAVFQAGIVAPPVLRVATDAGLRTVTVVRRTGERTHELSVDMGPATLGGDQPEWVGDGVLRAARVEIGNPHLVLQAAPGGPVPDVAALGPRANDLVPGGINVEVVHPGDEPTELVMSVYERGAGITEACGTGACAAAAAAHDWGLVPDRVVVRMPGGSVEVALGDTVTLTGPATSVAILDTPYP
jgi:diaminopimelate epimerase